MDDSFRTVAFADAARADADLARVREQLPGKLWKTLPTLLAQLPDPDGALNYLERFLRPVPPPADSGPGAAEPSPAARPAAGAHAEALRYMDRNPAALHYLLTLFSYSRFLSETLLQQPELVAWLHKPWRARQHARGIEHIKSQEELDEEFARFSASQVDLDPAVLLARFKRREYLRITLRDVLGLATLAETTLELSALADLLLARALHLAEGRLRKLYGEPQTADALGRSRPAQLIVVALGKLGARELNYSSDIDLMFFYTGQGDTAGGAEGALTNGEYFIRLSHTVLKLISEVTPEGAVFRVDVRLRPQGQEGFIAISLPAALHYYRARAQEWELQMLLKARVCAGDAEAGRRFLRELHPLIFRPGFNVAAVEAVLNARAGITRKLRRAARPAPLDAPEHASPDGRGFAAEWNVKLTPGGIRDIEFLAQCLQRLYGGADPWLSAPAAAPTLVALQRLHDKGHLTGNDFYRLGGAYQFLRKVEHRLQLRDGLQRHALPDPQSPSPGALERLARRCGLEPLRSVAAAERLRRRIAEHFADVREIYDRILVQHQPRELPAEPEFAPAPAAPAALLARLGQQYPALHSALRELLSSADPYTRRGLNRYLSAAFLDSGVVARLQSNLDWLPRAAEVFSRSDLAVEMFSRFVDEIALVGKDAPALRSFPQLSPAESTPLATGMTALRVAYCRSVLAAIVAALRGPAKPFDTFQTLSRLADHSVAGALQLTWADLRRGGPAPAGELRDAPFTVLALGRLGTREMDIASDADLVFITGGDLSADEREPWRRLAERLVQVVSSYTQDGLLFPVDTRLRPRGAEGEIVQSDSYLRGYLLTEARAWETATWLKARPVAGNMALGEAVVRSARAVLAGRWRSPAGLAELARQLAEMRLRLEREGTGPRARGEFKHLPGGFYDIEYAAALAYFRGPAEVFPVGANTLEQIEALAGAGALDERDAGSLAAAAMLFRAADHAHRLVTGRAANRPADPALARRILILLRDWQVELPAPNSLEESLEAARFTARAVYDRVFGVKTPA